jgi:germination protein M
VKTRIAVLGCALLLALLASGCGSGDDETTVAPAGETAVTTGSTTTTAPTETAAEAEELQRLQVYFLRGEQIRVGARYVPETPAVGAEAMRALLDGPSAEEEDAGLTTAIPAGTRLLGLDVADGIATVDLSEEFASGGGSLSIQARAAQVVHTLTQFATVRSVAFRLEGEPVDALGGEGLVLFEPVDRGDFEQLAPQILVESPAVGDVVTSPLRILGTANTFEATFMVAVLDSAGRELGRDFVTATSGSGERGTFDKELPLAFGGDAGFDGTLKVWEASAEDGSEIHVVEIPVRVEP